MPHKEALIGVVEDDAVMGGTLVHRLDIEGYTTAWWRTGQEALIGLRTARPDLVVCDIRLPDMSGEDVFLKVLPILGETPFLFVTAFGQIEQAVRLTKAGAVDYIAKPYALPDLLDRIPRLIAQRPSAEGVLGSSEPMRQLERLLRRVADVESSLLFTGRERRRQGSRRPLRPSDLRRVRLLRSWRSIARRFRTTSSRANYSGTRKARSRAHMSGTSAMSSERGTGFLFLDEVSELATPVQAKLLRLVEERAFTRVGGEASIKASARLIYATNVDLDRAVADGRFRRDLYYRINVIPIAVPALRERPDDILPLAHAFAP